jgi:hypothetical protein
VALERRALISLVGLVAVVSLLACAISISAVDASAAPERVGLKVTSGPKGVVTRHFATFRFTANPKAYDFKCKLDEGRRRPCSSPVTFRHLSSGTHYLQIGAKVRWESGGEATVELLRWTIR